MTDATRQLDSTFACAEAAFHRELEVSSGLKLKLRINDNRSTMLSVRWEPDHARVSIHRMFLRAPQNIMDKLACYLSGKDQALAPEIKSYIEEGLRTLDYSCKLRPELLQAKGKVYDLQEVRDRHNEQYFNGEASVGITWFGDATRRPKTRLTFGLYEEALKLVKIHRRLDDLWVPSYVVEFVVYHEMLHHVCPGYVDGRGHNRVHHAEFRRRERLYHDFARAQQWIKKNQSKLFGC